MPSPIASVPSVRGSKVSQKMPTAAPSRIFAHPAFIQRSAAIVEFEYVAAFCGCCGAEITSKAEACPVCGTPRHGMSQPDLLFTLEENTEPSQEDAELARSRVTGEDVSGEPAG